MFALDAAHFDALVHRLRTAGSVFAEDEAALLSAEASSSAMLEAMVERRASGEPIETIVGWASFCGLRIKLDEGVFVPRPRSELLVRAAAAHIDRTDARTVVDMCCGSGALAAAIAAQCPQIDIYATDVDPTAVACARKNVTPERVYQGSLYEALPPSLQGCVDLIVANAPYVPCREIALMPRDARLYEPEHALSGGHDGLDIIRGVAQHASAWLSNGGALLVETSRRQSSATVELLENSGFSVKLLHNDELGATAAYGLKP